MRGLKMMEAAGCEPAAWVKEMVDAGHKSFYKTLGCEQIGKEKSYPFVNNAPALALYLDLHKLRTQKEQRLSLVKRILDLKPTAKFITNYQTASV